MPCALLQRLEIRQYSCDVAPSKDHNDFDFTEEENKSWSPEKTDGLTLTVKNVDESDLTGITINREKVDPSNYTVTKTEDGIAITFDPEFLKTLSSGAYTMCTSFANGKAETQINIENEQEPIGNLGDLDSDGDITANDALAVLRYSVGMANADSSINKPVSA